MLKPQHCIAASLTLSNNNLIGCTGISDNLCNFIDKNVEADGKRDCASEVQISCTVRLKHKHEL